LDILPVDVVEEYWKGDCDLRSVVDEVYDTSARLPVANGIIRMAKQLPEVGGNIEKLIRQIAYC